jgi:hypothetical protein
MYRNVYYDGKKKAVHLWTWDENGKRVRIETSYEPYLYVESSQGTDGRSIFDTPLRKITFENQFERNTFVNETPITRLFHNISCEQDFLLQTFKDDVDKADFSQHPLKVYFLDIEIDTHDYRDNHKIKIRIKK